MTSRTHLAVIQYGGNPVCRILRSLVLGVALCSYSAVARGAEPAADQLESEEPVWVDNPATDGWVSEVMQNQASQQFKRLAGLLSDPDKLNADALGKLVADDFSCTSLRPQPLEMVYDSVPLRVLRGRSVDSSGVEPAVYRGASGLVKALRELVPAGAESIRVHVKIYRIAASESGFATRQLFTLFAQDATGSYEVHAVWRSDWQPVEGVAQLKSLAVEDYEETRGATRGGLMKDCTEAVFGGNESYLRQLQYDLDYWSDRLMLVGTEGMQGLAVGDVNGDGLDDVYICSIGPLPNRLYVQNPDGTATDQSAAAGVDWQEPSHSALLVDLDNDDDQDLLVSTRAALLLMSNDGTGKFTLRRAMRLARNAYSLAAADYDQDGDLDIFACVYLAKARRKEVLAVPVPFHDARNGGRNVLLRNDGTGELTDVTREVGLEEEATRRSFAASWEDYDNDGDPDLYVANDYGPNNLFRNERGHFRNVANPAGVEDQSFGMSASWADFNRDGRMDLYVSNMFSAAGNRIVFQPQFRPAEQADVRSKFQYMARGNSLFQNRDDGTFEDVSQRASIMVGYWSWGSQFADLNNDGHEDIVVANGFFTRSDTKDL